MPAFAGGIQIKRRLQSMGLSMLESVCIFQIKEAADSTKGQSFTCSALLCSALLCCQYMAPVSSLSTPDLKIFKRSARPPAGPTTLRRVFWVESLIPEITYTGMHMKSSGNCVKMTFFNYKVFPSGMAGGSLPGQPPPKPAREDTEVR